MLKVVVILFCLGTSQSTNAAPAAITNVVVASPLQPVATSVPGHPEKPAKVLPLDRIYLSALFPGAGQLVHGQKKGYAMFGLAGLMAVNAVVFQVRARQAYDEYVDIEEYRAEHVFESKWDEVELAVDARDAFLVAYGCVWLWAVADACVPFRPPESVACALRPRLSPGRVDLCLTVPLDATGGGR